MMFRSSVSINNKNKSDRSQAGNPVRAPVIYQEEKEL